jgi:hypothetical protein
MVHRDREYS